MEKSKKKVARDETYNSVPYEYDSTDTNSTRTADDQAHSKGGRKSGQFKTEVTTEMIKTEVKTEVKTERSEEIPAKSMWPDNPEVMEGKGCGNQITRLMVSITGQIRGRDGVCGLLSPQDQGEGSEGSQSG